jgi:TolB-like protein/Tfp pilus assembly protein PilF
MQAASAELIRAELEKILSSSTFTKSERISKFLRFVVEQDLAGQGDHLKEAVVGIEVFGRAASYDVRQDSVVRTEASKLRDRLKLYYATEGSVDPVVIELPKGGYRPAFQYRESSVPEQGVAAPSFSPSPPNKNKRYLARVLGVALVLGIGAILWRQFFYVQAPISIAVLPLLNMSQDAANDYFADGLTSEIIRNLSIIDGLTVRSQTSSFALKGKGEGAREAGKQLGVEYLLEGSVLKSGQRLRIDAQLVRVNDDFALWSGRYDRELNDVFAIQDEISRGIVNSLRLKLGTGRRRYETSTEAYNLYLQGRAEELKPLTLGMLASIEPFEKAVAKDPSFAPAWAALADAYAMISGFDRGNRTDDLQKMRDASEKAIQLDPLLAEAQGALGTVQARDAQWDDAEKSYRTALKLDPNNANIRIYLAANLLFVLGRTEEALDQLRKARALDPLSKNAEATLARILTLSGRFDESAEHCPPQSACLAAARIGQGRIAEAIQILEPLFKDDLNKNGAAQLGVAYARANRRDDAERVAAAVPRPLEKVSIYSALRDKERTIAALEDAAPLGPVRIGRVLASEEVAFIHDDPRVKALRQQVGLPK